MHIGVTDILTCPQCGPDRGLVLLAERIEARRVFEGWLGCANCRERYRVADGFANLRPPGSRALPQADAPSPAGDRDSAFRLAALMGIAEGPALTMLAGSVARHAREVSVLVEGMEVVALDPSVRGWTEGAGVTRIAAADRLPIATGGVDAVALGNDVSDALLEEGARVLGARGRLVVGAAPADATTRLEGMGLRIVARQADTVVAARA